MKPARNWVAMAAVVIAITPLVVATVRTLARGWIAIGDNGLILLRAQDVGTSHHPLLGALTSALMGFGKNLNHPGPLWFDVLAPFVRVAGPSVGLATGVMAANIAAIIGAAWAAQRAGGVRALVLVTALSAGLSWAMGSELLFDAWQPHAMILPFWALLVMCWSLAAGEVIVGPFVTALASLVVQTHLSFVYIVGVIVAASVAILAIHLRRLERQGGDEWVSQRAALLRAGIWTAVVAALAWLQPIVDQFAGVGNLGDLLANRGADESRVGLELGTRLVASVVAIPPWWTRPGFSSTIRATAVIEGSSGRTVAEGDVAGIGAAVLALLLVFALLAVVAVVGWRRQHRPTMVLGVLAAIAVGAALLSVTLIPVSAIGLSPHQMRWLWPISAFVLLAPTLAIAEWTPLRRAVVPAGLAVTGIAALANIPTHAAPEGPTTDREAGPTAAALIEQLSSYRPEGPVIFDVSTLRFAEPYSGPVLATLVRNGVDVVVDNDGMIRQLGERRRADGDEPRRLFLLEGAATRSPPPGALPVAFVEGLSVEERAELDRLRPEALALVGRQGLVLSDVGEAAAAAGRIPFASTVLAPGDDPSGIELWLPSLVADGLVVLTPDEQAPLQRYAELSRRFTAGTVGLFELAGESAG